MGRLVIEVSGPKVKAGLLPEGYEPVWRVPNKDAYYCVPKAIAESIRLHESWTEERAGFKETLETLFEKPSPEDS